MQKQYFAEIVVNNRSHETDKIFHYSIPEDLLAGINIGSRVIVPFGAGNKKIEAYVVGINDEIQIDIKRIKTVHKLADEEPVISEKMVELAKWMKDKYLCSYIEAIQTIVPTPVRLKNTYIIYLSQSYEEKLENIGVKESEIIEYLENSGGYAALSDIKIRFDYQNMDYLLKKLENKGLIIKKQQIANKINEKKEKLLFINECCASEISKRALKQAEVLNIIKHNPGIPLSTLKSTYKINNNVIKSMIIKGQINIVEKDVYREIKNTVYKENINTLTSEQKNALYSIGIFFASGKNVLLHGVTGSGKTEIYMDLIQKTIDKGKDAIVLVPEISLTPQIISRFKNRFGDNIAVLHSSLSEGEKYDEWRKIKKGLVKVAIGARSAVFAPFNNLGLIIIDEEHEHTYKSENRPKYHAREVAEKRCELEGANMILGSATPSIESYYKSKTGEYGLVELLNRVNGKPMPSVEVIDMREELKSGNKTIFSRKLHAEICDKLNKEEQIILFLNRRGYSTFVSCRQCGLVMRCPRCSISLTYHLKSNMLTCHYCGYERQNPDYCPKCKSKSIKYFGTGTQKVEKEFRNTFDCNNTLRMDADTTGRKNSHESILNRFRNNESKVLIGTQMIAKGLDFPNVTLVGVIIADTTLNMPDFRAAEKTFQMIAQVSGRSGRGEKEGKVIVQTYSPEHYSIVYAKEHDYKRFYNDEINLRRELGYPPFKHIANIIISGFNEQNVISTANNTAAFINSENIQNKGVEILGPAVAPMSKIKNKYRWQIVLKSDNEGELKAILNKIIKSNLETANDINISVDINPINML